MPDMTKMLFIRANRCDTCEPAESCDSCLQGFNALGHAMEQATNFQVFDLAGEQANQAEVYNSIDQNDPGLIYGFGHGNEGRYTAQHRQDIFNTSSCDKVNGRIVYLLSCLTANQLGPAMMQKGAVAYAGFNISWTWIAETDPSNNFMYPDPYQDKYAKCFYESANELWVSLSNGASFIEAVQASVQKYNDWIQYWYRDNPSDPSSQDCIMWLAMDRDGLVALTKCDYDPNITEQECTALGCNWINGGCQTQIRKNMSFSPALLIPLLLVVGIAFLVVKK